jgi:hypothetical protein
MPEELMAGYVMYTNAPDIIAEAHSASTGVDGQSLSFTVDSVSLSWTATALD